MAKKRIFLDTNFLLVPLQFKVDIYSELARIMNEPYSLHVLQSTLDEIGIIIERRGKNALIAKIAKTILEKQKGLNIEGFSKDYNVDDALVMLADADTIIATQDKELKARIKKKGAKIITLRQKKYLILE